MNSKITCQPLLSGSLCDENGSKLKNKEPSKSSEAGNIPQIQNGNMKFGMYPSDGNLVSSNGSSVGVPPSSFQFHVKSEEGINLIVDMNSSPSDWIKSLKSEVCIHPMQNSKSRVLHHELRIFGESSEQMKTSFLGKTGVDFQTKGDPNCIVSSLTERESGHLWIDHPDGTERNLRSSSIITSNNAVEISSLVEENDQIVSSVCKLNSELKTPIDFSSKCCLGNGETVSLGSEVPSISQMSTGKFLVDSKSGGSKLYDSLENQSKSDKTSPENCETVLLWTSVSSEMDLPMSSKICKDLIPQDSAILENNGGVGRRCSTSDSIGMQLSEVASHCDDTLSSRQSCSAPEMYHPINDLQTANGGSLNDALAQNSCSDPFHACAEEWGGSNPMIERESSECSQINISSKRTLRSSNSLDHEGLQSKRQHTNSKGHNGNAAKLAKKVLPRRSSRLVSK